VPDNKLDLFAFAAVLLSIAAGWVPVPPPWNLVAAGTLVVAAIGCFAYPRVRRRSPQVRDTWLREAAFYIVHGRWLGEDERALGEDGQISQASNVLTEMRQLARDGVLTVWGKASPPSAYEPIPQEYWTNHQIAFLSTMRDERS
jgi:hypothetical protein